MRSRDNGVHRLALDGIFVALALVLSYVESAVGFTAILPGAKLGIANLAVMLAFYKTGKSDAALISACRVILMSLLFGNFQYFVFSAFGAAFAYLAMLVVRRVSSVGRIGVSVASAAAHSVGQIAVAIVIYSSPALISYLPLLLVASALSGTINGILLILVEDRLDALYTRKDAKIEK